MNMKNLNKTDIGLIGLAVMGENLALNMADKGWNVSVYNRTVPGVEEGVVERFVNGRAKGKQIEGYTGNHKKYTRKELVYFLWFRCLFYFSNYFSIKIVPELLK